MQFFLCVIGMVLIFEGLPYFAFPAKMKQVIQQMLKMPDQQLRIFGAMLMGGGFFLILLVKM